MKIIDSHCHLVDDKIFPVVDSVISRAKQVGVEKFVTMAGGRSDWTKLIELSNKYPEVFIAFGWHPEDIVHEEKLEDLEKLILNTPKCIAIGEVGLDFYYDKEKKTKEVQVLMLKKQIEMAIRLNKKLVIHVRNAEAEMSEILSEYRGNFLAHFHCFGESENFLKKILLDGHLVSFGGNITFKSAVNLREMVKIVPLDQLMLETDTPYLSPEPLRGTTNEPANIVLTAQIIAKELKIETEELVRTTYTNTICFFGLEN
jgi:TatD DNase family protein